MHEYPVTSEIVSVAAECAAEKRAARVMRIVIVVGELTGFIGDSIRMYFKVVSKATPAEGAELEIEYAAAELICISCRAVFPYRDYRLNCPFCGSTGKFTDSSRELLIKEIELEI